MACHVYIGVCILLIVATSTVNGIGVSSTPATSTSITPTEHCSNLSGSWQNQIGTKLGLQFSSDGSQVQGWVRTALESSVGAAGSDRKANVVGFRAPGQNGVISIAAAWTGGSTTAWVGQCYVSESGNEYLHTMWLLRLPTNSTNKWMATRTGQDTFRRQ